MKKILASLLVLALCAPAMAATITITDNADCTATITVDATADGVNIVGLGLDVDVSAGNVTAVAVDTADFNIFPDAAYTQELGGDYVYGTGTPVAAKTVPGEIALPQSSFALSLGNLNGEDIAGADGALVVEITLTLSDDATLTVGENATRGGIVAVDGSALDAATAAEAVTGCGVIEECVKSTAPFYATWELFGKPDCWCYQRNCRGDADGLKTGLGPNTKWVTSADLTVFAAAYNLNQAPLQALVVNGIEGICADNDRAKTGLGPNTKWVTSADLGVFASYYNLNVADVPVCDMTNYNFWTN